MDDLVKRNGLNYQKFYNVPFTLEISDIHSGRIKKSKKNGEWLGYYGFGQLRNVGNFKDGKRDNPWEEYGENGQLKSTGNTKTDNEMVPGNS